MTDEYISKQAFNDAIREAVRRYPNMFYNGLEVARQIAHEMDAADVQPVRHGRWIRHSNRNWDTWTCSECGVVGLENFYYCSKCGAIMDGKSTVEVQDG